jgi:hypothetical protein
MTNLKKPAGNRRLAKKRVLCLNEAFCFVSSSVQVDSLVLLSPPERKALKRQDVKKFNVMKMEYLKIVGADRIL